MLIVLVAVTRIFFYIDDDGMTPRRVYAFVVCLWIGASLLLLALRLSGWRAAKSWLTPATVVTALVMLLALNAISPQRLIANNHVDRASENLIYHVRQGQFSGEGKAILLSNLDRFDPAVSDEVTEELCWDRPRKRESDNDAGGWLDYNHGRQQAENAVETLCES